jgi:hypothetical protein
MQGFAFMAHIDETRTLTELMAPLSLQIESIINHETFAPLCCLCH